MAQSLNDWLAANQAIIGQAQQAYLGGLQGQDSATLPDYFRLDTPYGALGARQYLGNGDNGEGGWQYEIHNAGDGGEWINSITQGPGGGYTASNPFFRQDETAMESITPFAMMLPVLGSAVGTSMAAASAAGAGSAGAGAAAAGAAEAGGGIAGGSGLTLGGTGAMTAGESMGAAGGSGLSMGGSALGESLGASGGSGLSLGGVSGGATSSLGGTLGASLSGLGDSTLSDTVLNGWGDAASAAAPTGQPASSGMSSADKAAIYGKDGYGEGMTGLQNSAYNNVLSATGSTDLAAAAGKGTGLLSSLGDSLGITDAAGWLKDNPTLGKLLFSGITSALSSAGNSGGGSSAAAPESYGPPQQWTSALQKGLYSAPKQVSLPTSLAGQLGINGASRWVR
jgi:hypothetical protein